MASVVKTLSLAVLTLVFALAFSSRAAPVSPLSPLSPKSKQEARFNCDKVVDIFLEAINHRAKARVEFDPEVLAWANKIESTKCLGNQVAQVTFRSFAILMMEIPKKDGTMLGPMSMCVVTELTIIAGLNTDKSMSVQKVTEMQILGMQPCSSDEEKNESDGGTPSSGGDSQLRKQSSD